VVYTVRVIGGRDGRNCRSLGFKCAAFCATLIPVSVLRDGSLRRGLEKNGCRLILSS
jgi:hypothetical protein